MRCSPAAATGAYRCISIRDSPEHRADVLAAAKDTAMNPVVLDAFALAIIAGSSAPAFPEMTGHEPDLAAARRDADAINRAMDELLKVVTHPGSYVSESNFFERVVAAIVLGFELPEIGLGET